MVLVRGMVINRLEVIYTHEKEEEQQAIVCRSNVQSQDICVRYAIAAIFVCVGVAQIRSQINHNTAGDKPPINRITLRQRFRY